MMQLAELTDYDGQLELSEFFWKSLINCIRIIEAFYMRKAKNEGS